MGNVDADFSHLFWAARREQNQLREQATENDPDHKAAIAFAKAQGWQWAEQLLAASSLDRRGEHDKALDRLVNLEAAVPPRWNGIFHFVLGAALGRMSEHEQAIKAYRKALDDANFDMRGRAWNNLGIALAAIGKHDRAIEAYREALRDSQYDELGQAANNLGVSLLAKGEPHEAIKAYLDALGDSKYDMPARAWTNLAQAYVNVGKRAEAESAFQQALACHDPNGGAHKRARFGLQLLKSGITPDAMSPDDRALSATPTGSITTDEIEGRIIKAIVAAGDTQYEKYIANDASRACHALLLKISLYYVNTGCHQAWDGDQKDHEKDRLSKRCQRRRVGLLRSLPELDEGRRAAKGALLARTL